MCSGLSQAETTDIFTKHWDRYLLSTALWTKAHQVIQVSFRVCTATPSWVYSLTRDLTGTLTALGYGWVSPHQTGAQSKPPCQTTPLSSKCENYSSQTKPRPEFPEFWINLKMKKTPHIPEGRHCVSGKGHGTYKWKHRSVVKQNIPGLPDVIPSLPGKHCQSSWRSKCHVWKKICLPGVCNSSQHVICQCNDNERIMLIGR